MTIKNSLLLIFSLFLYGCNTEKSDLNDLEKAFTDLKEDEYWGVYRNYDCFEFNGYYKNSIKTELTKSTNGTGMAKDLKQIVLKQNYGK